jgi:protein-S-isoprenylcysteine O-methyltransferase Ste14
MALRDEMQRQGNLLFRWRSYLPLLFFPLILLTLRNFEYIGNSEALDQLWELLCFSVAITGLSIRILTVGFVPANTSGRNTKQQKADTLNTTGLYSVVRHPLYLGNYLIWIGVTSFVHTWWLVLITTLIFWVYYERIMFAEEEFLKVRFGTEFEEWAGRTPAFIPSIRSWRAPTLPFSWRFVLARENPTLFAIIVVFFLLEVTGDFFAGKMPHFDLGWILLFCGGLGIYTVLRWMKKRGFLSAEKR